MERQESVRAEERTRPGHRAEHLREQLGGIAGRLCDPADRAQFGRRCTWCTIRNLEFRNNVVRHAGSAINILGIRRSCLDRACRRPICNIHDNLFYDIDSSWGGTPLSADRGGATECHGRPQHDRSYRRPWSPVYGGTATAPRQIYGFRYTNNLSRHGTYGVMGAGLTYGLATSPAYFPGAVFQRNLLSGGSAEPLSGGQLFSARLQHALRQHSERRLPSAAEQSVSPCRNGQPRSGRRHGDGDALAGPPSSTPPPPPNGLRVGVR